MSTMLERLPRIIQIYEEDLPFFLEKQQDPTEDAQGGRSVSVANSYRSLAVAKYVLHHDPTQFKTKLRESVRLHVQLFERHEMGDPIHPGWMSLLVYKSMFDALAVGEFDFATALAQRMGSQSDVEKKRNHPFDYAMGYTLKWFVLGDRDRMAEWCDKFAVQCDKPGNKNFRGYVAVFRAILTDDQAAANDGLRQIAEGHVKESKRGVFRDSVDEVLCVWGLGMANLCRWRGLMVEAVPPLIPADLLVSFPTTTL